MQTPSLYRKNAFIQKLGNSERIVLVLYYYEELTIAEIGLVLELPEEQVLRKLADLRNRAHAELIAQPSPRAA